MTIYIFYPYLHTAISRIHRMQCAFYFHSFRFFYFFGSFLFLFFRVRDTKVSGITASNIESNIYAIDFLRLEICRIYVSRSPYSNDAFIFIRHDAIDNLEYVYIFF